MKIILVNGSPNKHGCTYTALQEAAQTFEKEGFETETFWVGKKPISGCLGCHGCAKTGKCVISDVVNDFLDLADTADGFLFGSPVHYAAMSGAMTSFMDRAFFAAFVGGRKCFYLKPAAGVISARRAGTTATFDQLNKYFSITQMPIISSQYWNMVHGKTPDEVKQDAEGMQTMRTLARNMAWFLQCKQAGLQAGVPMPTREDITFTNFIR